MLHLSKIGVLGGRQTDGVRSTCLEEFVEFLVVADGELEVAGDDAVLVVVSGRVARQLEYLSREVLQHCRQVHRCPHPHSLTVVALHKHR